VLPTEIRRRITVDFIQKWLMMALGTCAAAAQWVSAATSLHNQFPLPIAFNFFALLFPPFLLDGKIWE
jgi:hypothetical protein